MKQGYLQRAQQERVVNRPHGGTRAWMRNAWRIVDATGRDLIQPWCDTKAGAREVARQCDITLLEPRVISH